MRTLKTVFCVISFMFVAVVSLQAADIAKIGVFNLQKVGMESDAGRAMQASITKQHDRMSSDLELKKKELDELGRKIETGMMVMNSVQKEELEREYRIRLGDLQALKKKYEEEIRQQNINLIKEMQKVLLELIDGIGKKEGYLLILEQDEAGIAYFPSTIDITDKVIKKYNEVYAQQNQ